ncbi:MAG: tRNA (adenosine(37)-N6)-threonylcarbamoyltransferase complex dimerization subunit type 1 TsaB [Bacilli bacterium]|nr:tRNA (adenosine(37)-N6)-threonylcarbamoyltransferase complex dimerization subunit type 1 TsaB [Bacilli bacterium]
MRYLYIDTSSSYLYSAIVEDDQLLAEIQEEYGQSLSEITLPKISFLFQQAKLSPKDIDKIIVVNGPGSFTGIRIGLTIAKVYAWSLQIPITTIYSLEAMALSSDKKTIHIPLINARRGYVFAAIYDENQNVILKPRYILLQELQNYWKKYDSYEIITNDVFEGIENTTKYVPNLLKIVQHFKDKSEINPHAVNPEYLKLTEAEESKL